MLHNLTFPYPVLLIDDEEDVLTVNKLILHSFGVENVVTINDGREVLSYLDKEQVSVIVMDLMMPYMAGIDLLPEIVYKYPTVPVIVMTAAGAVETAVNCMRLGAFDFITKPVDPNVLIKSICNAQKMRTLQVEVANIKSYLLPDQLKCAAAFSEYISQSHKIMEVFKYIEVIAPYQLPILITGETGTGKELIARAIHKASSLTGNFVAVNAAGLDDTVFTDTLFGHKKGAFTGADQDREGMVVKAAGGTLFLDEIGDLSPMSQVKLLRFMQDNIFYPMGSDTSLTSDARIVFATNHDLEKLMLDGKFRKDLYYRLSTHLIKIPPLRERLEDIPLLLDYFIGEAARTFNKPTPKPEALLAEMLTPLRLTGNIREFKAMVTNAVAQHQTGLLTSRYFPALQSDRIPATGTEPSSPIEGDVDQHIFAIFGKFPTIVEMQTLLIKRAYAVSHGQTNTAATLLGITRKTLHRWLKTDDCGSAS